MFPAVTLRQEIRFVQGLNKATGRRVGIYPELKHAAWHREQGIDLTEKVLELLDHCGYLTGGGDPVFLQCFDPDELKQVYKSVGASLPIIQLLNSKTDVDSQLLREISEYATGIGPSMKLIYRGKSEYGKPQLSTLVERAHDTGLVVHPYTFRADDLPAGIDDFNELLELFICQLGIDGIFTDFTDCVADFRQRMISPQI
jgi:glycerophosphoryl diester phosphodiesterase